MNNSAAKTSRRDPAVSVGELQAFGEQVLATANRAADPALHAVLRTLGEAAKRAASKYRAGNGGPSIAFPAGWP
jgi:hypothetical protein